MSLLNQARRVSHGVTVEETHHGTDLEAGAHQDRHVGVETSSGYVDGDTQEAVAAQTGADHEASNAQTLPVGAEPSGGLEHGDSHEVAAARNGSQAWRDTQINRAADDAYAGLLLAADFLDDVEELRKATASRLRVMTDGQIGKDGIVVRPPVLDTATEKRWKAHEEAVHALEAAAELELKRALRKHPLGAWVKSVTGVGEKQGARLLAAIGDPYWNSAEDRPRRGPAELWAYCGSAPDQKRQKGVRSNWNADGKMRAFLVAEAAMKAGVRKHEDCDDTDGYDLEHREPITPLGAVYLNARAHYVDAVHAEPCHRCGPSGHPAEAGSPLSSAHQHARALRKVSKAVLKDLYIAARDVHTRTDAQGTGDVRAA